MDEIKKIFRDRIEFYQKNRFNAEFTWEEFQEDILNSEENGFWNYKQKIIYSIIKVRRLML